MSKHNHYFKDVSQLSVIDVYRTLILFCVTDPCIQHAVKKLLVAGGRGAGKDISQDIQEAIDSLERWKQMREEDNPIYNRRVEDKSTKTEYPELHSSAGDELTDEAKTTGKFKIGDKVSIHNVTDAEIPYNFECAEGVVVRQYAYNYDVKFTTPREEIWSVYERQMQLVEKAPVAFKVGDRVKILSVPRDDIQHLVNTIGTVLDVSDEEIEVSTEDSDYWYFDHTDLEKI